MLEFILLMIGFVVLVTVLCIVFSVGIGFFILCACIPLVLLSPIHLGCLIHMKIKGYKSHEYHFLGSTIKISLGEDEDDK